MISKDDGSWSASCESEAEKLRSSAKLKRFHERKGKRERERIKTYYYTLLD